MVQSRSPNSVLLWKPNQFPAARFGRLAPTNTTSVTDPSGEEGQPDISDDEQSKRQYLRDRFKPGEHSGVDDPESPCGRGTRED